MRILSEHDTIRYLLEKKCSIARYGDGELKLCFGKSAISQKATRGIKNDLRKILKSKNPNCLIGIPRIKERTTWVSERKRIFWNKYKQDQFYRLYDSKKQYGSAFVTRGDAAPEIDNWDYYELVKQLWLNKPTILIQGEFQRFNKSLTLLGCSSVLYTMCEARRDAYKDIPDLISYIKRNVEKGTVVVISLGPAATVLAYELSLLGIQALDLGHMGQFYSHVHPKSKHYTGESFELG